ncbi:hypothetical protein QMN16_24415, partial [Citrobacter freundii]|nr:hypothetical protein [Citrobacter freundii]
SAQIREILISESAWEEMTCLFAPSLVRIIRNTLCAYRPTKNYIRNLFTPFITLHRIKITSPQHIFYIVELFDHRDCNIRLVTQIY